MRTFCLSAALFATLGLCAQDDVQRTYAQDGTLLTEQTMVGERLQHTTYHSNGQVKETGWYSEQGPEGTWKQYAADGTLLAKGRFSAGQRTGRWLLRNPADNTMVKLVYRNSTLVKGERSDANGTLLAVHQGR